MTDAQFTGLISVLFFLLMGVIAWIANKADRKLSNIEGALHTLSETLHDRITGLDRRVTAVETKCSLMHDMRQQ